MNRLLIGGCLLSALGLFTAAGVVYWVQQPTAPEARPTAWALDQDEQMVSDYEPGKPLQVQFVLRNVSSNPYRVLGGTAC